jgi:SNF2 family DNA or RNA helicase
VFFFKNINNIVSISNACGLLVDDLNAVSPKNGMESPMESSSIDGLNGDDSTIKQSVLYRDETLWKQVEEKAKVSGYELLRQGVELKPYQIWGVNWLLEAFYQKAGAILADEMGR